jgi:ribosome-binding factor A
MLHRDKRAAELIRAEVAKIINNELADPKLGFVTVIGTRLTKDLKRAIVFVSVIGDAAKKAESVAHLERAKGRIRHLLAERIVMRYLPEISFEYDTLLDQEERVAELLAELHRAGESEPDA